MIKKNLIGYVIAIAVLVTPFVSFNVAYAKPIVPECGKLAKSGEVDEKGKVILRDPNGKVVLSGGVQRQITAMGKPCDFKYLMELINNIIDFLLFIIAAPIVALILCYAGFIMITSGGSSEKVTKAKHMFKSVVFGYIIALAAWLIIKTILTTLGFNPKDAFLDITN